MTLDDNCTVATVVILEVVMRIGDEAVFCGYSGPLPDVPAVFVRGDRLVVVQVDDEGIYRCQAVASDGRPMPGRSDLVLEEEVIPLTHAGIVPLRTEGQGS